MNGEPLGLISLDELVRILPDLIADALRQRETRPPPPTLATLTKSTGLVIDADTTTAEVQLDEDEPGVLSHVQLASAVAVGDRVVVLMSPGGGAVAIGSGAAQTAVPLLVGDGDPNGVVAAPEGWLYLDLTTPNVWQNTDSVTAWEEVGTAAAASSIKPPGFFGDGSDGAVTISGSTSLTRDMYYTTLVVANGGTLTPNGWRISASVSITVDSGGIITRNGADAAGNVRGLGAIGQSVGKGTEGANGRSTAGAGAAGTSNTEALGGSGGGGGISGGGNGGGAGGSTAGSPVDAGWRHTPAVQLGVAISIFGVEPLNGGAGGGAGGAEAASNSGAGGGGGGALVMCAPIITNNGTIRSNGGNGGNASGANAGGGGGGGGGVVLLTCNTFTGTQPTVTAGTFGTGIGTGVNGVAGSAGLVKILSG